MEKKKKTVDNKKASSFNIETSEMQSLHNLENVRSALDKSAIVAITDAKGVIIHVNDKFCEISKYSREDLIGKTHKIVNSGHHTPGFFADMWKTISDGEKWDGEIRNRAKDGSYYWVHTVIVPFLDAQGKIKEYVSIRYDITEKKESENNLQNLIEAAFEGLLIYDLSGKILWTNSRVGEVLGRSEKGLKGEYVSAVFYDQVALFEPETITVQFPMGTRHKTVEVTTKQYYYKNHRCYLMAVKDISDKVALEAQILQQDRMASIGMLASGLAHEIGTPLGIMRGRAELLLMKAQENEAITSGLQIIIQQIDRVTKLIQSLLGLARGGNLVQPERVQINTVVEDVFRLVAHEANKNQVQIENKLSQAIYTKATAASLYQVFLNLFVNAIFAINEQSKIDNRQGKLSISAFAEDNYWKIDVTDNGCGIAKENFAKLFTPFFTTKEIGVGTGLGLATTYKIIHSWGGSIHVDSEPSKGTTFSLLLPKG